MIGSHLFLARALHGLILLFTSFNLVDAGLLRWVNGGYGADDRLLATPWTPPNATSRPRLSLDSRDSNTNNANVPVPRGPAPTSPPAREEELEKLQLVPRQGLTNTCGYVNGKSSSPLVCASAAFCQYNTVYNVAGCCYSTPCAIISVCHDYSVFTKGGCANVGIGTGCCTNPSIPSCITYSYLDYSVTQFFCWSSDPGVIAVYYKPTETSTARTTTTSRTTTPTTRTSTTDTTSSSTPDPTTTSNDPGATKSPATNPGSDSNSGLSRSDQISLGVGIGVGLPATIATVWGLCLKLRGR